MTNNTISRSGLTCRTVDALPAGSSPKLLVFLCHGYGAPGTDLVPLAGSMLRLDPVLAASVQFVFPEAPLSLDHMGLFGGRAWWHVDVGALAQAVVTGRLRELMDDEPAELIQAREMLTSAVRESADETGIPLDRVVLGGFSQGAMLSTDVALRIDDTLAGLCVMSGTLKTEQVWRQRADLHKDLRVLMSHGRQDPIVPFIGAVWLNELLVNAGLKVEFIQFDGDHTIPQQMLTKLADMLCELVNH
jgi:phospholipase/carboxylesterase